MGLKAALNAICITDDRIPAKLEGAAIGADVMVDRVMQHTLWIFGDNDFVPSVAGRDQFYAFASRGADLPEFP